MRKEPLRNDLGFKHILDTVRNYSDKDCEGFILVRIRDLKDISLSMIPPYASHPMNCMCKYCKEHIVKNGWWE